MVDAEDSWHFEVVASEVKNKIELPKSDEEDQEVAVDAEWVEPPRKRARCDAGAEGAEQTAAAFEARERKWR